MHAVMAEDAFIDRLRAVLGIDDGATLRTSTPFECGADSLSVVELATHLEDLGVALPEDLRWDVASFGDLYQLYVAHFIDQMTDRR